MKSFKNFIFKNKGKLFLLVIALFTVFLFIKGKSASDNYLSRSKNMVSVLSTITNIEEKTRQEEGVDTFDDATNMTYDVTYYQIEATYIYDNHEYKYYFDKDSLTEHENGKDKASSSYYVGKNIPLLIDSTDPEFVFDKNPGIAYTIAGCIFAGILAIILLYCLIYKFYPHLMFIAMFSAPFFIGAIIALCAGIYSLINNKSEISGSIILFLIAPIFSAVSFLFYKLSKLK